MRKSKEDKGYDYPRKLMKLSDFKIKKKLGGFDLTILKVNKFTMIEWKFTIDFLLKSKAISCRTYSHDHV